CVITGDSFTSYVTSRLTIANSIFTAPSVTFSSNAQNRPVISHCIGMGNYLPPGSGNLNNQFLTGPGGVFQAYDPFKDTVELRADSPAKGAGSGGVDIGATAGPTPYVVSGVPA